MLKRLEELFPIGTKRISTRRLVEYLRGDNLELAGTNIALSANCDGCANGGGCASCVAGGSPERAYTKPREKYDRQTTRD